MAKRINRFFIDLPRRRLIGILPWASHHPRERGARGEGYVGSTTTFGHSTLEGPRSQSLLVFTIEGATELGWWYLPSPVVFDLDTIAIGIAAIGVG